MHEESGTVGVGQGLHSFHSSVVSDLVLHGVINSSSFFIVSDQTGKKIRLDQKGNLDIYIALDASDSIEESDFNQAKGVIKKLLNKVH